MTKVTLINADVMAGLKTLPDESVQCVVTSPPYWGLRDYGIEPVVWGGEPGCAHEWGVESKRVSSGGPCILEGAGKAMKEARYFESSQGSFCRLCSAWRGSFGLEPTIELYVQHTVEIFREVRRVLRRDGVLFLNLGDSYASGGGIHEGRNDNQRGVGAKRVYEANKGIRGGFPKHTSGTLENQPNRRPQPGLKPKDLCGVPWRVALALQADGWWLRSDIIWAKPKPMPESCTDRPTKAHEYIFLLTKSATYFWDQEAVREGLCEATLQRDKTPRGRRQNGGGSEISMQGIPYTQALGNMQSNPNGRNLRTVWEIATAPFPQAHFATFPPAIPERCIKVGTSEKGCCPKCGSPWKRVVENKRGFDEKGNCRGCGAPRNKHIIGSKNRGKNSFGLGMSTTMLEDGAVPCAANSTLGWTPGCKCASNETRARVKRQMLREQPPFGDVSKNFPDFEPVPCVVLDPFFGAGTTGLVAAKLGRDSIGIELNPDYCDMARKRIQGELGMLCEVEVK